jgi:2-methylcitrate dehydratase PrpD
VEVLIAVAMAIAIRVVITRTAIVRTVMIVKVPYWAMGTAAVQAKM